MGNQYPLVWLLTHRRHAAPTRTALSHRDGDDGGDQDGLNLE